MTGKKKLTALATALILCLSVFSVTVVAAVPANFGSLVFEGKDGWLFYAGDSTIEDYQGTDLYTLPQLTAIRLRLTAFSQKLSLSGTEFVIFIAPNKEQLYAQFMPDSYGPLTEYTRAQQVTDYLRAFGFRVVYPIEELKQAVAVHPDYDFYYRRDTHWNELGSYIGARALLRELGIDLPPCEELKVTPVLHDSPELGAQIGRSLADIGYTVEGYTEHPVKQVVSYPNSTVRGFNEGADGRRVLLVGDSFSIAPFSYLCSAFNDCTVCSNRWEYDPALFSAVAPDIYIYEAVERYVGSLDTRYGLE